MCDICMHSPCLSGCPNAPDPTPVTYCRSCGEPIVPGDEYADIDGEAWCEGCLDDLPLCVLIPKLGWEWKTVQEGENVQCVDCKCCGDAEPLPVGAEYGEIDGDAFCEECLEDTPLSDLVSKAVLSLYTHMSSPTGLETRTAPTAGRILIAQSRFASIVAQGSTNRK